MENQQPPKRFKKRYLLYGFFALIIIVSISKVSDENPGSKVPSDSGRRATTSIEVTALQLFDEYDDNEVSADIKYKGKQVSVSGTVEDIAKDIMGDIYVTLRGKDVFSSVQCFFDNEKVAANLKKGDRITLTGTVSGKMMNVIVRECEIK